MLRFARSTTELFSERNTVSLVIKRLFIGGDGENPKPDLERHEKSSPKWKLCAQELSLIEKIRNSNSLIHD